MINHYPGVLYITYDGLSDPLGQSQILPYLKGLSKKNVRIIIVSFEKRKSFKNKNLFNRISDELNLNGIKWLPLKYHKKPCFLATLYDVICGYINGLLLIYKHKLSIVHTRGYISSVMGFWLKKSIGIKFLFDMRGFWVEEKVDVGFWNRTNTSYKIAKSLEKIMLNFADKIVVLTEKAKPVLINYISKALNDIEVIPTCVDLKKFNPLKGKKKPFLQKRIVILYSGSIGSFYGFKDAIDFFQLLYDRKKDSFFLVLINNRKEIAEDMLKGCGLPQESYKVLSLSHSEVSDWLNEADVSLIFYHRDNSHMGCCPTKFGESLACGVPVIANKDIGDCDEIIKKEKIGIIIGDFSDFEYKKAIDEFLSSLKDKDILRIRCRNVAERLFSLDSGVEKYLNIYNKLIL